MLFWTALMSLILMFIVLIKRKIACSKISNALDKYFPHYFWFRNRIAVWIIWSLDTEPLEYFGKFHIDHIAIWCKHHTFWIKTYRIPGHCIYSRSWIWAEEPEIILSHFLTKHIEQSRMNKIWTIPNVLHFVLTAFDVSKCVFVKRAFLCLMKTALKIERI